MAAPASLLLCPECDSLQRPPGGPEGTQWRCHCCGAPLGGVPRWGLEWPLALESGALILFLIANAYPLLSLHLAGNERAVTFLGAVLALWETGEHLLAGVVLAASVVLPGWAILSHFYLLLAAWRGWRPPLARELLRLVSHLRPWGMLDVFMLGILVALVKLTGMAEVDVGRGLLAFVPLILFTAGATATLEPELLWRHLGDRP